MNKTSEQMSLEEYLNKYGVLTYKFRGVSMLPMLREKYGDLPEIRKRGADRLKKYDVALYKSSTPGRYILHRIVKVIPEGYIFLGDNCVTYEHVYENQVIGVLTRFHRGKKPPFGNRWISVDDRKYILYSKIWVKTFRLRKPMKKIRWFIGACWHKGLRILYIEKRK